MRGLPKNVAESSETIVGLLRPILQFQKSQGRDWDRDYNIQSFNVETETETDTRDQYQDQYQDWNLKSHNDDA